MIAIGSARGISCILDLGDGRAISAVREIVTWVIILCRSSWQSSCQVMDCAMKKVLTAVSTSRCKTTWNTQLSGEYEEFIATT